MCAFELETCNQIVSCMDETSQNMMDLLIQYTGTVTKGNVRLNDVQILYENPTKIKGRVEVYHNDEWGSVCTPERSNTNAQVVCR